MKKIFNLIVLLVLVLLSANVCAFTDAILLEKGKQSVLLFGDLHVSALDYRNNNDVLALFKGLCEVQLKLNAASDSARNSIIYYEYEASESNDDAGITSEKLFTLSRQFASGLDQFRFVAFDPRATKSRQSASFEGLMNASDEFLLGHIDMPWANFRTLVKKNFYEQTPNDTMNKYLQELARVISTEIQEREASGLSDRNALSYLSLVENELKEAHRKALQTFQGLSNQSSVDTMFNYLDQNNASPDFAIVSERFYQLHNLVAHNLDYRLFDYSALCRILKSLQENENRSVIMIAGRDHIMKLKEDFAKLGFSVKECTESVCEKIAQSHQKKFILKQVDVAAFVENLHKI